MVKNGINNVIIIPVLLSNDKTPLNTITSNTALCPIYFTIGNLNHIIRRQRRKPSKFLMSLILIYKGNNVDVKLDIYHICLRIMTKHEQNSSNLAINIRKILCYLSKANQIVLELEVATIKGLKMICVDGEIWWCYSVIAKFTANYKKYVVITNIKSKMHCPIYTISANKYENLYKD